MNELGKNVRDHVCRNSAWGRVEDRVWNHVWVRVKERVLDRVRDYIKESLLTSQNSS
jgi:hypothetical protein